jgi:uncharacterized protein YrrD
MNNIQGIKSIIGRPVLSVESANTIGCVHDLVVDPLSEQVTGFSIQKLDKSYALIVNGEIHSIGPDALMVDREASLVPPDQSPIKTLPLAGRELIGVKVFTERGALIGKVANVLVHFADTPILIYEVRSSIFAKLLGHTFYFPASLVSAFSDDRTSIIVSDDRERMGGNLEAVTKRLFGRYEFLPHARAAVEVTIRSHSH